jgi:hypothetical protein
MWERIVQRKVWLLLIVVTGIGSVWAGQWLFADAVCQRLQAYLLYGLALLSVIVVALIALLARDNAFITQLVTLGAVAVLTLLVPAVAGPALASLPEVQSTYCPDSCITKIAHAAQLRQAHDLVGAEFLARDCVKVVASVPSKEASELELARILYDKAGALIEARQCDTVPSSLDEALKLAGKHAAGADLAHAIQERQKEFLNGCATPTPTCTPVPTLAPTNTPVPMQVDILRRQRTESIATIDLQVLDNDSPQPNLPKNAFSLTGRTGMDVPILSFEVHTADDPVCAIAVVDNSGSITPHVADIKNALRRLNDKRKKGEPSDSDQLGLVLFAGAGEVKIQPPSTADLDPEVVIGSGGTALWDGILEGLEQAKSCDPALPRYLFVLTDGDDNQSIFMKEDGLATNVDKAQAVALQAAKMNVGICAIGVQSDYLREDPLKKVTYGCRNGYRRAAEYNEVAALFEQIFGYVRDFYRVQFSPEAFVSGHASITLHVQGATEVSVDFGN